MPCVVLTVAGCGGGQAAVAPPGDWVRARQLPGTELMSRQAAGNDGKAVVGTGITSVACTARGECAASGGYVDEAFNFLVFVAGQYAGRWGRAGQVPGVAALVGNGQAAQSEMVSGPFLSQVSCSSPGNCAVAGNYQAPDPAEDTRPLLADERGGVWGRAKRISGPATAVLAISCPAAAGDCAAGGLSHWPYTTQDDAFVVNENGGVWGRAQLVSGSSGPITTMSCPAAGSCLAAGTGGVPATPFIVSERNGRWGPARQVPGFGRLTRGRSEVDSVSCADAGDCAVAGSFTDGSGRVQSFVADERGGVWGTAEPVPGLAALNKGGKARVTQVSCDAAGSCAAGGWYLNLKGRERQQAWVDTEARGRWGLAETVPGTAALNKGGNAAVTSVSCAAARCLAGGWYTGGAGPSTQSGFLVTERRGAWRTAAQVPGLAALSTGGYATVKAVSCAPSGWCAAVGDYTDRASSEGRMFVISGP